MSEETDEIIRELLKRPSSDKRQLERRGDLFFKLEREIYWSEVKSLMLANSLKLPTVIQTKKIFLADNNATLENADLENTSDEILEVFDNEKQYSTAVLVFETVKGISLREFLLKNNNDHLSQLKIIFETLWVLAKLQELKTGFRHGDLHLENVMVVTTSKPRTRIYKWGENTWTITSNHKPVVIDFGRAWFRDCPKSSFLIEDWANYYFYWQKCEKSKRMSKSNKSLIENYFGSYLRTCPLVDFVMFIRAFAATFKGIIQISQFQDLAVIHNWWNTYLHPEEEFELLDLERENHYFTNSTRQKAALYLFLSVPEIVRIGAYYSIHSERRPVFNFFKAVGDYINSKNEISEEVEFESEIKDPNDHLNRFICMSQQEIRNLVSFN